MEKITIITDSTSDLPKTVYENLDLIVVPLSVIFKGKTYIDNGIDINPVDFYKMIESSPEMPHASQPTLGNFINIYSELTNQGRKIISIHISGKLSGTMNSAELAARQFQDKSIEVVDSEVVHMSLGFIALKAAKMASSGSSVNEILSKIVDFREKINSFFLPKSLDNLIKGGRVNKIKGRLASLLEIKPILTLKDGEVSLYKNSRSWKLAKREMLDSMEKLVKGEGKLVISIGDVASKEDADEMEDQVRKRFYPDRIIRTNIGIVVGSHLGIGGLGITFFEE